MFVFFKEESVYFKEGFVNIEEEFAIPSEGSMIWQGLV